MNNPSQTSQMKQLIDALENRYPSVPIYVQRVFPVGAGYSNASTMNSNISAFNSEIESYCSGKDRVTYIDTTDTFIDAQGYLSSGVTGDNLHIIAGSYSKWIDNIKNKILRSGSGVSGGATKFEDQDVITPGIGEITKVSSNSITIKFTEANLVKDFTMTISGFQVDTSLSVGDMLDKEQKIGVTLKEDIVLILRSPNKAIIENIEDYMPPPNTIAGTSAYYGELTEDEFEMFAAVLYSENGIHGKEGLEEIAHVIKNRALDTVHFSDVNTITDVLIANGQYGVVHKVPGSGSGPNGGGGEQSPPAGKRTFVIPGKGEYWVSQDATDLSREVAREVLDGVSVDRVSAILGRKVLFQRTAGADNPDSHCYTVNGETYSHNWGCMVSNCAYNDCSCTNL